MECEDERIMFNKCETLFDSQESTGIVENFCAELPYIDEFVENIKVS